MGMKCSPQKNEMNSDVNPHEWFKNMINNCHACATEAREKGKHIVGIMCEYTPRELIMAAEGIPVCLCGGSAETIPDAERELPANLCPLIKSSYGYHVQKSNPFLEMSELFVAETTCDGKKKMFELMGRSRTTHILELPQKVDDADAFTHWKVELNKLKAALEEQFNTAVTDEKLRESIAVMNRERSLRRELAECMKSDIPPFTGRQLLEFKSIISGSSVDFQQYERILAEVKEKQPPAENGNRVRVMLTGVPTAHGAERVIDLIEEVGGIVVCMENCTGLKPILEDVDTSLSDPIEALAHKYFHLPCSVMTENHKRLDSIRVLSKEYRVDCVIDLIWHACLTYDVESTLVKNFCEQELQKPYLKVETDYSPSDSERIKVRVETLFETIGTDYSPPDIQKTEDKEEVPEGAS